MILSVIGAAVYTYSMLHGHGRLGFDPKGLAAALLEIAAAVTLTSPALERWLHPDAAPLVVRSA